jgi:signal peptidase II
VHATDDPNDAAVTQPADLVERDPPPVTEVAAMAPARAPRVGVLWWLTTAIIVVDQITKALVRNTVSLYDSQPLIPGLVDLAHVRNEGVAFGLFNSLDLPFKWAFTTALALAALAGITYYARHIRPSEQMARVGLSMILGGAIGNLIDRMWAGYVLDFVDVYWRGWHFWAFNVADACISIGAVLVFFDLLFVRRDASHSV